MKEKIAILTGGGDCPGLNAVIRAITKKAILQKNLDVIGIKDGYDGLLKNEFKKLTYNDVSGILNVGGTILGTSNKANPYRVMEKKKGKIVFKDYSKIAIKNLKKLGVKCLVCIGGDGTLSIANKLSIDGVNIIGVPKTIDNDLKNTDITFGFDSAVKICTQAIDSVHTTAESHHRIMIVEVMGRNAGWIALYSGIAGGGDIILIPEIDYDINIVAKKVKERSKKGKKFSIIVVSEGAKEKGKKLVIQRKVEESTDPVRLGGIGLVLGKQLEELTNLETRTIILGHLQRSGSPTAFDRILSTRLGSEVMDLIENKNFGNMIGVKGNSFVYVPLKKVANSIKKIPLNHNLISVAKSVGTCFGV